MPEREKTAGEPAPPRRILVVDDETVVRESLRDCLEEDGFEVTAVTSAEQALEVLGRQGFDMVISDLVMPGMNGIELIAAIRGARRDVPLLVMTGYASIERAVESMKAGAADFITKPLKFDHVKMVIGRVLETAALRKLAEEREYYKDLSDSDGLTQVGNYRHFSHMLQLEIDRQRRFGRPVTLLMIDIDDFKKVNDRFGHLAGDMVLIRVAALLRDEVRGFDFVARYGGDEFTVILPEISAPEAVAAGRRILRAIAQNRFQTPDKKEIERLGVTIGIASFPRDAETWLDLVAKADGAMYAGKSAGKNCLCVSGDEGNILRSALEPESP